MRHLLRVYKLQEFNRPKQIVQYEVPIEHRSIDEPITDIDQPRDGPMDEPRVEGVVTPVRSNWSPWLQLAIAVVCLGWTFGGRLPMSYLLGNAKGPAPQPVVSQSSNRIRCEDGSELYVETFGLAKGPTLLLTHGWTLDSSAWSYIRGDLAKHYRIVAWDLAGLGKSKAANNGDQSLEKMAHDLETVRQATCADTPVILVGHSIGGMIQHVYCRLFAEHLTSDVRGIVMVHTTYTNPVLTNIAAPLTRAIQPILVALNYLTIPLAPLAWLSNWQSYHNGSIHMTSRLTSFSGKQTREQLDRGARLAARAWPAVVARGKHSDGFTRCRSHHSTIAGTRSNNRGTTRSHDRSCCQPAYAPSHS